MRGERRWQTHLNDDLETVLLYSGCLEPVDHEVVVAEAEKVKEENQEMAAYVKWMDVAIPFSIMFVGTNFNSPCGSESKRRLRKFWNATVCYVTFSVFKDCSNRHIYHWHSSWIELTVAFMGSSTYPYELAAVNFLYLSGSAYVQLNVIPDMSTASESSALHQKQSYYSTRFLDRLWWMA